MKLEFSGEIFEKTSNVKFRVSLSNASWDVTTRKEVHYLFCKRLSMPHSRYGLVGRRENILLPPRLETLTVHTVTSRYTGYARPFLLLVKLEHIPGPTNWHILGSATLQTYAVSEKLASQFHGRHFSHIFRTYQTLRYHQLRGIKSV